MSIRKIAAALLLGVCASVASCSDGNTTNPSNSCGDDVVGGAEACDGADLAGKTCESLGLGAGTLGCVADCSSLDTSQCGAPATCGDGKKDAIESCDGNDLGGQTCGGLGLGSGNLGCQLNCLGFETSNCSGPASCGNGQKDGTEVCDGNDLGGQTCESAGAGTGTLACATNCGAFDTSGCVCAPACGGLECGLDPLCGQSCGECEVGAMCDAGKCIEICDLPRITMDKVLDLDATTVTITGTVTLNGAPMPNDTKLDMKSRGRLRFRNVDTLDDYEFEFGETGAVNYTMTLFSGVYDVYVVGNLDTMQSVLPGSKAMLIQRGLELKTNSTQNFDAKTLTLSGNVTLNGATMPNDTKLDGQPRGTLRFVNVDTLDEYTASLGEMGAVTYSQKLFVGTYNVYVHGNLLPNQSVLPPDHDMLLQKNVAYSTTMTRDFDARTLTLSGKVTHNGVQMPDDTKLDLKPRGFLRLRNTETFDDYDISLLETGPANYSQTVFAGLYDVRIVSNNNIQQSVLPDAQEMIVQKGLTLSTDSVKDFDAKVLTISGAVTLNGLQMPNDTKLDGQPRGTIVFYSTEVIQKYEASLGETGPAAYSYKLFHGLYDVLIQAKTDPQQSVLPPTHSMLMQKGLALTGTTMKNFDAKTLTVSGAVTLNGAVMPNDTKLDLQPRARLRFYNLETNDPYDLTLGETGAANYTGVIFAGLYDVYVRSSSAVQQSVLPGAHDMKVDRAITLATNTMKDYDAKVVTISGKVTLNGAPIPNDTKLDGQTRGRLRFWNLESTMFDEYALDFGEMGPFTYSQKIFASGYDVLVYGNTLITQSVFPPDKDQRLLKGCRTR